MYTYVVEQKCELFFKTEKKPNPYKTKHELKIIIILLLLLLTTTFFNI